MRQVDTWMTDVVARSINVEISCWFYLVPAKWNSLLKRASEISIMKMWFSKEGLKYEPAVIVIVPLSYHSQATRGARHPGWWPDIPDTGAGRRGWQLEQTTHDQPSHKPGRGRACLLDNHYTFEYAQDLCYLYPWTILEVGILHTVEIQPKEMYTSNVELRRKIQ